MEVSVRRTTLRRGAEAAYTRLHAHLPDRIATALLSAGILSWQIWRDGRQLVHVIATSDRLDAVIARMSALGPLDPAWDAAVGALLENGAEAEAELSPVWALDAGGQWAGDRVRHRT
jgi:L-rhamnose mutarotase